MTERKVIYDSSFGEMIHFCGWRKSETLSIWDNRTDITIIAEDDNSGQITDIQRKNYEYFIANTAELSRKAEAAICEYVSRNYDELSAENEGLRRFESYRDFGTDITLTSILFTLSGKIVFLLEAVWDEENGLGAEVFPKTATGPQSIFL